MCLRRTPTLETRDIYVWKFRSFSSTKNLLRHRQNLIFLYKLNISSPRGLIMSFTNALFFICSTEQIRQAGKQCWMEEVCKAPAAQA